MRKEFLVFHRIKQKIEKNLIDEIKKFRESYPAEKSYEARIPIRIWYIMV